MLAAGAFVIGKRIGYGGEDYTSILIPIILVFVGMTVLFFDDQLLG